MSGVNNLKQDILNILDKDPTMHYKIKLLLTPVFDYSSHTPFYKNVEKIVDIVTIDRNDNDKFDLEDVKLLSKDMLAITSLVSALVLLQGSIPSVELKFDKEVSNEMIFKLLVYVFLYVLPIRRGVKLSVGDKKRMINIIGTIYDVILSSQIVEDVVKKVGEWFKSSGFCSCLCGDVDKENVVNKRLPQINREIENHMSKNREIRALKRELSALKK